MRSLSFRLTGVTLCLLGSAALGSCTSTSATRPPTPSPSPRIAASPPPHPPVVTGTTPGQDSPEAAVAGFVDATAGGQINVECQYVLPSQQAACPGYLGDVTLGTLGPDTVGAAYRSGSQAVVAATGTYCWQNNCTPNSNPRQGMPLNDAGFNAAYAAAPGRTKFGNPIYACQLVGGQWFIDLGIATSPPASPVSSP